VTDYNKTDMMGRGLEVSVAKRRKLEVDPFIHAPAHVGMEMFLEFRLKGNVEKTKTNLIGYSPGRYLVISTPRISGASFTYGTGTQPLVVRYFLDGSVFGFESNILRMVGAPFNVSFLSYPAKIEEVSLRKSRRLQVVIPVERDGKHNPSEMIVNLSDDGALLQLKDQVSIDDEMNITFSLPDGQIIKDMTCYIRRVEINRERILAGIEFDPKSKSLECISNYLEVVKETIIGAE